MSATGGVTELGVGAGWNLEAAGSGDTNSRLQSFSGKANLVFQADGNLVVYDETGKARWASGTAQGEINDQGFSCRFQTDGNLVVYDAYGKALWASGTSGHPNALLMIQNDGNVVVYDPYPHAIWATSTEH